MNLNLPSWIDLHLHSTASDGELAPEALVAAVAEAGVQVMALTDHDSVAGLAAARAACEERGLQLVNGVEISCRRDALDVHVVGLGIDPENAELTRQLAAQMARRAERAEIIATRLKKAGVVDVLEAASVGAPQGIPARPHFARALVAAGVCKDEKDAFGKYLALGKPAYVKMDWPGLEEAIGWIRGAGGVAVLAHPHRYKLTRTRLDLLLRHFREAGGGAVEVAVANQETTSVQQLADFCSRYGLHASKGSDYHGPSTRWVRPGRMPALPSRCQPVWSLLGIQEQDVQLSP
ncbi:MAG TPA: PHP domain-containing protein [Dongiaceae bacterium]|nr:PHP domain-containing protein [Dongiaceae bacterium]